MHGSAARSYRVATVRRPRGTAPLPSTAREGLERVCVCKQRAVRWLECTRTTPTGVLEAAKGAGGSAERMGAQPEAIGWLR